MKNLFIFILISIPTICFSNGRIHFELAEEKVTQGSLIKTKFKFLQNSAVGFRLENLEGITVGDTLYINQILPINGDPDGKVVNGEATIVFIKVPEKSILENYISDFKIEATWTEVSVLPTEIPKELLFGEFSFPETDSLILWIFLLAGTLVFLVLALLLFRRLKKLKLKKLKKLNLKNELLSPISYNDVVQVWEMKHEVLKVFPNLGYEFTKLEQVLFKYLFKPQRSKLEEEAVLVAYRNFIDSIKGEFDGV
jgi:hypothetical protein